ncbi:alginate lyase family protein [uncultured Roseobacter sp.]|uniref:alginate lyase family protein n=1 Tax=uncultured Roseobacter sp. TaxID=114847 RepID=UPI0026085B0F|nr:alginate lyase family protein [uncultured Roseobacter sp.]
MHSSFDLTKSTISNSARSICLAAFISVFPLLADGANAKPTLKETVLQHLAVQKKQRCDYRSHLRTRPAPVRNVDLVSQNKKMFKNAEQYAGYMHANATRYFFGGDTNAGKNAINLAVEWAQASAHESVSSPYKSYSSARYPTYMVIGSTLNALFLLDANPHLDDNRRAVIWGWTDKLVKKSYITRELPRGRAGNPEFEQRVNNHNGRRATILAYYAAHKNDQGLLRRSNKWAKRSFAKIKSGVMYDAIRGDWALNYSNLGIAALVEHTAFYGIVANDSDRNAKIRNINSAAQFLFRETLQPNQIHQYAKVNSGRGGGSYGGKQVVWWNKRHTNGLTHYAWIDTGLLFEQPPLSLPAPRYSEIGGYSNCWF